MLSVRDSPGLCSVLGQEELDELLAQRDKINLRLQKMFDRQTDPWGIKVTALEVRDLILPDSMKQRRPARGRVGAGMRRAKNHKRRRPEFQSAQKTRAGGIDDFRATDCSATPLLTDDEEDFERS
jgi:regulator of protease activity HflC (stomatin/prohibitin superfamily)